MDTRHYFYYFYYYYRSDETLIFLLLLLLLLLLLSDNCYLCWTMIELVSCGWFEIVLRGQKGQKRSIHVCVCVSVDRWTASWMCATLMYKLGLWLARRLCTRVRVMLSKNLLIYCQTGSTNVEPTFYHYILLLGVLLHRGTRD